MSNIKLCYNIFDYLDSDSINIEHDIVKQFLQNIINDHPLYYSKSILTPDVIEHFILSLKKIKDILKIKINSLNSLNKMQEFYLGDIIKFINKEHYHQNMNTSNIPSAYPNKKKELIACCSYHEESLFEHSILAMGYSILHAILKNSQDKDIWIAGFTGLFHDIGKVNTMCVYGKEKLGYPFHGSYGSAILSQYGSNELFEEIGGIEVWEDICRTIQTHMCSYHTTEINDWTMKRRTITQMETPTVKSISENLSWGDSFGKLSTICNDISKFVESRDKYNNDINQEFDVKSFMETNKYIVPVFFIRGISGSGKTEFIKKKLLPYLEEFFSKEMIEIVSRDEIMSEITSKKFNMVLSKSRPTGVEYKNLYEKFRESKLSKHVNDEIKRRLSIIISQRRIPIIDSCILYYDGIISCIPENISKSFLIAVDCIRNYPYNIEDAEKNGMNDNDLENLYKFRNIIKWVGDGIKLTILDSIYTHNNEENLQKHSPQLVFSYGWNEEKECGFQMMTCVLNPIMEYFSSIMYEINTDSLDIIQYVNYLYKKFGLDGMKDIFVTQFYKVLDSHKESRILRINYFEHNKLWRPKWSRQTRGTTFFLNDSDEWIPIKFLLERGTEALTGLHVKEGITSTDNIDIGAVTNSIEDLSNSIDYLDNDQINLITKLVLNQAFPEGLALTFKKDGSLLGCTIYKNKEVEKFMKNFILNSEDELAITILQMCDKLNLPLMVFSTQSTVIVGNQMHDYMVHALLASFVFNDVELKEQFSGTNCISVFEQYGNPVLLSLYKLLKLIDNNLNVDPDDTITLSMESICANRKSIFKHANTHTELAISYDKSSITVLGVSFSNISRLKYLPHYKFTEHIKDSGLIEPAYWFVFHTEHVNRLLTNLHNVIYGKISEEEFYIENPPSNITNNWEKMVDYEGFVCYSMFPTINSSLNYNKIKTAPYYDLHKVKKDKINWILQLAEIPSVVKRFPICKEINAFYSDLSLIEKLFNLVLEKAVQPDSILFTSLTEKAKISFVKQPKQVQIKMLINSPNGFERIAVESLQEIYQIPHISSDSEHKEEIRTYVKKLLMSSIDNFSIDKLKSDGSIDELFLLIRKLLYV
jgi:hypothetical protein